MLRQSVFLLALTLLTACSTTPGLYEKLPVARTAALHKVLVLSVVGDTVHYVAGNTAAEEQVKANEVAELSLEGVSLDDLVETHTREAIEARLKLETVSPPTEGREALFQLYRGKASPYDDGLTFSKIREPLRVLAQTSGADSIVLIFKGVQPLPGNAGNWVQGAAISASDTCALYPNAMVAILDAQSLKPLAVNHVRAWESEHNAAWSSLRAPAALCRKHLQNLSDDEHDYVLTALAWAFRTDTIEASLARLLATPAP